MADTPGNIDLDEQLTRLARQEENGLKNEHNMVLAPGAAPPAAAIKIVSLVQANVYLVQQVSLVIPGAFPSELGGTSTEATNMAESFLNNGTLSAGTYAIMWRVAGGNAFYVKPDAS